MEKRKHIFWELILLVGGVFVFRSMWHLMDRVPFYDTDFGLWLFLIVGTFLTAIGFYRIVHADRGKSPRSHH
jgi:uncharacterized membrane protein YczE